MGMDRVYNLGLQKMSDHGLDDRVDLQLVDLVHEAESYLSQVPGREDPRTAHSGARFRFVTAVFRFKNILRFDTKAPPPEFPSCLTGYSIVRRAKLTGQVDLRLTGTIAPLVRMIYCPAKQ